MRAQQATANALCQAEGNAASEACGNWRSLGWADAMALTAAMQQVPEAMSCIRFSKPIAQFISFVIVIQIVISQEPHL
jgi:hypothetical protein